MYNVGYSETQSREKMKKGIEQLEVYKKFINILGSIMKGCVL